MVKKKKEKTEAALNLISRLGGTLCTCTFPRSWYKGVSLSLVADESSRRRALRCRGRNSSSSSSSFRAKSYCLLRKMSRLKVASIFRRIFQLGIIQFVAGNFVINIAYRCLFLRLSMFDREIMELDHR